MAQLFDRKTGQSVEMPNEQVADALSSGQFGAQQGQRFNVRDENGEIYNVPVEQLRDALGGGFRLETDEEATKAQLEDKYGGTTGELLAGAAGAARSLSFGLSDVMLTESGIADKAALAGLKDANPAASTAGEVAGVAASLLIPGGAIGKAGQAAEAATAGVRGVATLATGAEKAVEVALRGSSTGFGRALLAKGAGAAVGGAIEGALFGAGQVVSEAALGDPEEVAEKALAHIGLSALLGGATAGVFGMGTELGAKAIGAGLKKGVDLAKARGLIGDGDNIIESFAQRKAVKGLGATPSRMGAVEEKAMVEEIGKDLLATHEALGGKQVAATSIADTLDNIRTVRSNAGKRIHGSLKALDEVAQQQVEGVATDALRGAAQAPVSGATIAERLRTELLEPIAKQPGFKAERDIVREFIQEFEDLGDVSLTRGNQLKSQIQKKVEKLFGREIDSPANELRKSIAGVVRDEVDRSAERVAKAAGRTDLLDEFIESKRLFGSMAEAEKLAKSGVKRIEGNRTVSLTDYLTGGAFGIGGTVLGGGVGGIASGAAGALVNKFARERGNLILAKVAHRAARLEALHRIAQTADTAFVEAAGAFMGGARRAATPTLTVLAGENVSKASEILTRVAFGPEKPAEKNRQDAYIARTQELSDLMAVPEVATERMARRMESVSDAAPETAAVMATVAMGDAAFLHSKAARPPPPVGPFSTQTKARPAESDVRRFENYVRALENPMSVVADLADGKVNAEGAEALRVRRPRIFERIRRAIEERVAATQEPLSYQKLVQLSVLYGEPLHATMVPSFVARMQASSAAATQQAPGPGNGPGGLRLSGLNNLGLSEGRKTETERLLEDAA